MNEVFECEVFDRLDGRRIVESFTITLPYAPQRFAHEAWEQALQEAQRRVTAMRNPRLRFRLR